MNKKYMEEPIDLRRFITVLGKRLYIVAIVTILGILLGAGIYKLYTGITNGEDKFRVTDDFSIDFNLEEFINATDYYNAYTWNAILHDDPIVNPVMEELGDVSRETVLNAVESEMLSDYRILTVYITTTDKELSLRIADAYERAMIKFGQDTAMITEIQVWSDGDALPYYENTRTKNAAFLGGLIGLVASLFAIMLIYVVDDGIYSERDWRRRYEKIPYLGNIGTEEYKLNADYILGDMANMAHVQAGKLSLDKATFDELRQKEGVILGIRRGLDKGQVIDETVYTLEKQDVSIRAVEIIE